MPRAMQAAQAMQLKLDVLRAKLRGGPSTKTLRYWTKPLLARQQMNNSLSRASRTPRPRPA